MQLQNPHLWGVKFDQKTHKSPPLPGRGRVGLDIDRCISMPIIYAKNYAGIMGPCLVHLLVTRNGPLHSLNVLIDVFCYLM